MLVQISEARFRAAYQLGRQVTVRSFEARDTSEHVVMVHFLGRVDDPETQKLIAELAVLPPGRKTGLEGAFQVGQEAVVVTRFMAHVRSFDDWFVSVAGENTLSEESSSGTGMRSDIPYDGPTILTAELEGGAGPTRKAGHDAERRRATEGPAPKEEAGDFTRMFGPIEAAPEHPVSGEPPGEIVPSFGDAPPPDAPPGKNAQPVPPEPPRKQLGEFTRMFGALTDEPPEASEGPAERPASEPPSSGPAAPSPAKSDGGFTEMFGPTEGPPADPGRSQTLVEQPGTPSPPIRAEPPPEAKRPAEPRQGKPRIVWRDRSKEQAPPRPEEPQVKVRRQRDDVQQPPPPAAPPAPPPKQKPGQFTEIFGQALSAETESAGSQPAERDEFDFPMDRDLPPQYTGPRKSVSEQVAPLPERASSDYLRALSGDSYVEPPRPALAPEPSPKQQEQTPPDLPPPISSAPPPAPGPSDYTRVVAGGTVQPREAPPPPPPPAPAPAASPEPAAQEPAEPQTPTWLWIALAAIAIVAVLLVVLVLLT